MYYVYKYVYLHIHMCMYVCACTSANVTQVTQMMHLVCINVTLALS